MQAFRFLNDRRAFFVWLWQRRRYVASLVIRRPACLAAEARESGGLIIRRLRGVPGMNEATLKLITSLAEWLPPLVVGTSFTLLGSLKLYGILTGIVGGHEKPLMTRLC